MAVEFKFPWRFIDKSGNVVADGYSQYEDDAGDFYLNDDGVFENKDTGQLRNGDIVDYDEFGNRLTPEKSSDKKRAFGEIRTSSSTGSTPAFNEANNADKPKIENPEKPQTDTPPPPSPPPNNGSGSGGGLIGEISKQNEILKNLTSKVGQTTELSKISRGLGSLERAFKRSLDNLAKEVAKGSASIARSNEKGDISASVKSLKGSLDKLATVKDDLAKISENGKGYWISKKSDTTTRKSRKRLKTLMVKMWQI